MKNRIKLIVITLLICQVVPVASIAANNNVNHEYGQTIFISDIHLCDSRAYQSPNPYCWFNKNSPRLVSFLNWVNKNPNIKRLVILGDLLDGWMLSMDKYPLKKGQTVKDFFVGIASATKNVPIINTLQAIDLNKHIQLAYVPGNHDMLISKGTFLTIFPHANFYSESRRGAGKYVSNDKVIVAEHGHVYGMYNAPNSTGIPGHLLPFGYFLTRPSVEFSQQGNAKGSKIQKRVLSLPEIIRDPKINSIVRQLASRNLSSSYLGRLQPVLLSTHLQKMQWWENKLLQGVPTGTAEQMFAKLLAVAIYASRNIKPYDLTFMRGMDNFFGPETSYKLVNLYQDIFTQWQHRSPSLDIDWFEALINEGNFDNLFNAAKKMYMKNRSNPQIVIFGHTHIPGFLQDIGTPQSPGTGKIYVNSGTWIDGGTYGKKNNCCTFVVTQKSNDRARTIVKLKRFISPTHMPLLQEGYVYNQPGDAKGSVAWN